MRPAPPAGDPSIRRDPIAQVAELEPTEGCGTSDSGGSGDDSVSSDDDPGRCAKAAGLLGTFVVEDGVDARRARRWPLA